jgi:hypothetical protein
MAGVNISQLIISTGQFPKLSDQSESAFLPFLVSYWLNVMPFLVSKGNPIFE